MQKLYMAALAMLVDAKMFLAANLICIIIINHREHAQKKTSKFQKRTSKFKFHHQIIHKYRNNKFN